jgi:hypothetical protein
LDAHHTFTIAGLGKKKDFFKIFILQQALTFPGGSMPCALPALRCAALPALPALLVMGGGGAGSRRQR